MFPTIDRPIHTVNKLPCHCGYCTHCQQTSLQLQLLHTLSTNFLATVVGVYTVTNFLDTVVGVYTVNKLPCHCSYCTHCQQTSLQLQILHTLSTNFLTTVQLLHTLSTSCLATLVTADTVKKTGLPLQLAYTLSTNFLATVVTAHTDNKLPCNCRYCTHCQQTSLPLQLAYTLSTNFLATVDTAHTVNKLPCHCGYCTHCQQTSLPLQYTVNKLPCQCSCCANCQQISYHFRWFLAALSISFLAAVFSKYNRYPTLSINFQLVCCVPYTVNKLPCHCRYCTHC